jgi:hypothetical protein
LKGLSSIAPVLLAAWIFCPATVFSQAIKVENLCRLHGIEQPESVALIRNAYQAAIATGISEDELLPFVEDILKHKLDCNQMVLVLSAATRLRKEELPYYTVFSKVREGVAKEAPPALVVEAAEAKFKTLTTSRDVLKSLEKAGYRVLDFQNAAVIVSSYIEKGYSPAEVVSQIGNKGIDGAGFGALSGVLEKSVRRKER